MANTPTTTVLPTPPSANAVANAGATTDFHTGGETFKQNLSEFVQVDRKVFFASADRNKDVILDQLRPYLDNAHQVLEVGSGSGQHTYHFSKFYPDVIFQPTEYDTNLLASIDAYASDLLKEGHLIRPALELDATNQTHWYNILKAGQEAAPTPTEASVGTTTTKLERCYDMVMTTNVFHISPWIVGQSIVRGAGQVLKSGGWFVVYGAFKKDGTFNTESNREFDKTLRGKDASWGVRDIEEIETVGAAEEVQLKLEQVVDMPSNNYMLFFQKK
ncbi:hypothetical protein BGX29_009226 [Mortierella sp. GBA35]|nr:hypothetical protein BGX23_009336 [Mortierella sp. AD031]KAF9094984.1 hypothetical protein BGX29_009226 [Mortierella sp. GBA35]KAG0214994.1 hypothetical protein BGX33_001609 [Mortierella sp. NVP41]